LKKYPYIVNVLEVFEENNTAYIAMEYISGFSLKYMLDLRMYFYGLRTGFSITIILEEIFLDTDRDLRLYGT